MKLILETIKEKMAFRLRSTPSNNTRSLGVSAPLNAQQYLLIERSRNEHLLGVSASLNAQSSICYINSVNCKKSNGLLIFDLETSVTCV
jgi:hypothetical protein